MEAVLVILIVVIAVASLVRIMYKAIKGDGCSCSKNCKNCNIKFSSTPDSQSEESASF